jgi:putative ABC transport system ATP-binding protein
VAAQAPSGAAILRRAIGGQRRDVALGALLLMAHQAAEALVPVVVGVIIDEAIATSDGARLAVALAVLAGLFVVLSIAFRLGFRLAVRAEERAAHELRVELAQRVLHPAGGAEAGRLPGELLSIATSDAQRVGTVNLAIAMGAGVVAAVAIAAVVLLRISLPLGLLVVLGLPPVLAFVQLAGRPLSRRAAAEQERAAATAGLATDLVRGLRVLKGIGAEDAAIDRYHAASRQSLRATLRAARAEAAYDAATSIVTGAFLVLVALVAARQALAGDISVGELIAAIGLAQFLIGPLARVSYVGGELARARASAPRAAAVLAAPPAVQGGTRAPAAPARGELRLRGLSHGALRDVNADLPAGAFVGLVAAEPQAARALLECLARDADPAAGAIELDGVALTELDPAELHRAVLVAPHDADLFEQTLVENVAAEAGGPGASARLDAALAAAVADEVADALPKGRNTKLAERGSSLSGGQRQRVALARALAANPAVLVLHDPTTAVDAATEARIAAGVRKLRRGRSTLVLTTSPALLAASDHVIVIANGTVADSGEHGDLLRRNAAYRTAVLG